MGRAWRQRLSARARPSLLAALIMVLTIESNESLFCTFISVFSDHQCGERDLTVCLLILCLQQNQLLSLQELFALTGCCVDNMSIVPIVHFCAGAAKVNGLSPCRHRLVLRLLKSCCTVNCQYLCGLLSY